MNTYLVVDDDEAYRNRLSAALRKLPATVLVAESVSVAQRLFSAELPHRVIVDLRMPEGSGLALVRWIREQHTETAIVVVTGYGSIATTQEALRLGADGYVTKPASLNKILQAFEAPSSLAREEIPVPTLAQVEWDHINRILLDCSGNISRAAKLLGMDRRSLQRKLQKSPQLR